MRPLRVMTIVQKPSPFPHLLPEIRDSIPEIIVGPIYSGRRSFPLSIAGQASRLALDYIQLS